MSALAFDIHGRDGEARTGALTTPRGTIRTPAFMPVGTAASVKAMFPDTVRETGADIILGNTYHLMLRPGAERIARLGGLHDFMNWPGPILTDSGGFQVMSLSKLRKLSEDGVTFQSHIDGSTHLLTPERAVEIQCLLGSDIQMQLDECPPYPCTREEAASAVELSLRWAERSQDAFAKRAAAGHALFGIVQGSIHPDLRERSARALMEMDFPGYAIGGLAVGEGPDLMLETLAQTTPHLPADKPRYLMGVGTPLDIVEAVARGVDMFDCVMPTRSGRHGQAFTWAGKVNLRNAAHADDPGPLDPESPCPAARDYSRAYLHHLVKAGEYLAPMLLTWANVAFYQDLMRAVRAAIQEGRLDELRTRIRVAYG
ncbi:tRNA guanosine(34) transglycosylase Tgt [Dichotomicrobium thermohalophilum]|uniref:Queuine tRNA-ribosyltransferase n=1 Tax=Dichotomicrobium thermohalophilum TaxID=933063 RepID=A0A397Q6Y7_9HYPH|nr:tRNA guanosine(34) transglycosylase Tgt [Dichotomicrobium thermohalophilum]RIA56818.1 tRNA-guanine transglycosylase [Dichotomicrobium thermohalophilum]